VPGDTVVVAGTTDGCASFLATGADRPGDGVSALGTTLTVKMLSERPLFAPEYGLYSHRIGDMWLAGGASNTGGAVLAAHFSAERITELSAAIDPAAETGLDFYPLTKPGERFPIADPALPPRMAPRPAEDGEFLKAIFEGIAGVESLAYERLAALGGPRLRSVRTVGGGAGNPAWTAIRARKLGVPFLPALSEEAAAGTARLALSGAKEAGVL
jgi:sugar (pentulose or hexulose) kinase